MLYYSKPVYAVEFASAKRIRLSLNFQEGDELPMLELPKPNATKSKVKFDIEATKSKHKAGSVKDEHVTKTEAPVQMSESKQVKKVPDEDINMEVASVKEEAAVSVAPDNEEVNTVDDKALSAPTPPPTEPSRKMDISMLCASESTSPTSEIGTKTDVNGSATSQSTEAFETNSAVNGHSKEDVKSTDVTRKQLNDEPSISNGKANAVEKTRETAGHSTEHHTSSQDRTISRAGSKKRMIVDDDTSNGSSDSESGNSKKKATSKPRRNSDPTAEDIAHDHPSPATKRRKVGDLKEKQDKKHNKSQVHNKTLSPLPNTSHSSSNNTLPKADNPKDTDEEKPECFDVTCASCTKSYDMRYLDPPLVERPADDWRCFECLVNDARGWPRRRKSVSRSGASESEGATHHEGTAKRKSSSSKSRSSSSSKKRSSSSLKRSSSSKSKSSLSSSKHKKSSTSHSSSSKKTSSSSSKKHKKRKSSSSSSHHHSSGSSHHKSRRHRHHHEQFAKLVDAFHERQARRLALEESRIRDCLYEDPYLEGPSGWRVVSSTLDELRQLIASLVGGSLEQDR